MIIISFMTKKHTSKIVKNFIRNNEIPIIEDYPSMSCDLNPIEHIWRDMKRRLDRKHIKNVQELEKNCFEIWNSYNDNIEFLETLACSLPNRLDDVIKANGGNTEY